MPEKKIVASEAPGSSSLISALLLALSLGALVLASLYSYLLFHTFAEMVSIIVAMTYAVIAWHTRATATDGAISALGIAYFFVALLDLFHTLSYAGMGVFQGFAFPANQVWVLARFLEAAALLSLGFVDSGSRARLAILVVGCVVYCLLGLGSIFVLPVFPVCFVAGKGQTGFKVAAELLIILVLVAAFVRLRLRRSRYRGEIYRLLLASIGLTALSELCFTAYLSNFDYINMAGHLLKIVSFWLIYRAVVVTCLERPSEMLYGKLREALVELEASNATKDDFIAILGHDLRNPLSGISGVAGFLAEADDRGPAVPSEQVASMHREIAKASNKTMELLERVLAWARSQSGALKPLLEELDAEAVIAEAVASVDDAAAKKSIEIRTAKAAGLKIVADREMLATILRNLMSNAVKFTARGGRVEVVVAGSPRVESIAIVDQGMGIDRCDLERIFRVSGRISRPGTEGERGTGFGLALCMEFATKMGYSLSVTSEAGKGSIFSLELSAQVDGGGVRREG
jgi:signal transduction histidine kinase